LGSPNTSRATVELSSNGGCDAGVFVVVVVVDVVDGNVVADVDLVDALSLSSSLFCTTAFEC
jgi:hypothetical protein